MTSFHFTRRSAFMAFGTVALVGGAGALSLLARNRKEQEKYRDLVPAPSSTWLKRVHELHGQIDQADFLGAAESAGHLSNEAFERADRVVQSWLALRDTYRGFLPRRIRSSERPIWNYQDCAADMYCHFVIEASLIGSRHLGAVRDILEKERATSTGVPGGIFLDTGEPLAETLDARIFGAVEYAKDGLLPILERIGPSDWLGRMHEIVDAIIAESPFETRYGPIPSEGTEKNGEFLQVLARLYHRDRRPEHLAAGRAIADLYTHDILPSGDGLPIQTWSFDGSRPLVHDLQLRDHNNEIIAGLAEWLVAESAAPASRATEYRAGVERMMDTLLDRGRDAAGLWLDHVLLPGVDPPRPPVRPVNDNWGYLTAGYVGYALSLPENSERRQRYLAECARAFTAAIQYRRAAWQRGQMDGYADSVEGALYLLPFLKVDGAARWIDEEIGVMLAYQQPDGFAGRTYLDGNFVRTALLYALFRTQGTRLDPWQPGLRLGAIRSPKGLHIAINSDSPWSGRIIFDRMRHRDYLNLPYEYPRLNGWTEWFTPNPKSRYEVTRRSGGRELEMTIIAGSDLIDGIGVNLTGDSVLQMIISPRE